MSYMVDRGFRVIFDKDEASGKGVSMMVHRATGRATRSRRDRNVWVLDAYVKDGNVVSVPVNVPADGDFHRRPRAPMLVA